MEKLYQCFQPLSINVITKKNQHLRFWDEHFKQSALRYEEYIIRLIHSKKSALLLLVVVKF